MSVAKGSSEEPWLLELHYNCPDAGKEREREGEGERKPTVLVGKGATFEEFYMYTCKFHGVYIYMHLNLRTYRSDL